MHVYKACIYHTASGVGFLSLSQLQLSAVRHSAFEGLQSWEKPQCCVSFFQWDLRDGNNENESSLFG